MTGSCQRDGNQAFHTQFRSLYYAVGQGMFSPVKEIAHLPKHGCGDKVQDIYRQRVRHVCHALLSAFHVEPQRVPD